MALIQCRECGATISDKAPICPQCAAPIQIVMGESQQIAPAYTPTQNNPQQDYPTAPQYKPDTGIINLLSFIIPWAGWVLYFVYKSESPQKAKHCAKWAWIGFTCRFVLGIIYYVLTNDYWYYYQDHIIRFLLKSIIYSLNLLI